jgi:hypothetical protein
MRALDACAAKVNASAGSLSRNMVQPTAYDAALRRGSVKELEWIDVERAHVLAQVGGALPMGGA